MLVSISSVLTTIAVVWIVILVIVGLCETKSDGENVVAAIGILMTIFSVAIVLYRIGSFIFSLIGG